MAICRFSKAFSVLCVVAPLVGCGNANDPWTPETDRMAEASQSARNGPRALSFVVTAGEFTAQSSIKPWSSWWFPASDDFLYAEKNGIPSPLQKYDTYTSLFLNRTTNAAGHERENAEGDHDSWAGLCYAWALASIMEPEPQTPRIYGSVRFEVGDLKALLLKTYEAVTDVPIIGDRNDNSWDDVYADVVPFSFHQVLLTELFQNRRPFIIDRDAGHEVWNMPVYKATTKISADQEVGDKVHVRTVIFVATSDVTDYDYVGTEATTREYTYDLYGKWKSNQFTVTGGSWTGNSRADHPDFIILQPNTVQRASLNPDIDVNVVDTIVGKTQ